LKKNCLNGYGFSHIFVFLHLYLTAICFLLVVALTLFNRKRLDIFSIRNIFLFLFIFFRGRVLSFFSYQNRALSIVLRMSDGSCQTLFFSGHLAVFQRPVAALLVLFIAFALFSCPTIFSIGIHLLFSFFFGLSMWRIFQSRPGTFGEEFGTLIFLIVSSVDFRSYFDCRWVAHKKTKTKKH